MQCDSHSSWGVSRYSPDPDFWNEHTATELRSWKDHDLKMTGRLTHPMCFDHQSDRYVEVTWDEAFEKIGKTLQRLERQNVVFYSSGHAGLEASYLYALLARAYGNNKAQSNFVTASEAT